MEAVQEATESSGAGVQVPRYRYELERGIAPPIDKAQVGDAVAGGNPVLSPALENLLSQLVNISERLGRLEHIQTRLVVCSKSTSTSEPQQPSSPSIRLNRYFLQHPRWQPSKHHLIYCVSALEKCAVELALAMSTVANGRVHFFDKKKVTRKSSSLRKHWRLLRMTHPDV
ncbi:hypothetical protein PHMEG_00019556 [Phytophthora megakarya]|uniref:Uncharacterized protein n=1 Tax=Phytophthora megakarya TaxID=4795 RepID=A0A225VRN1_9STRA|nr:hypothetical protein PHMEG_00019556 [Phytophthora megakarya]